MSQENPIAPSEIARGAFRFMQFMLSVQSTPDPASPPGSRSVPGHDQATPALKRLNSPVSIFDALDESPPRVPNFERAEGADAESDDDICLL